VPHGVLNQLAKQQHKCNISISAIQTLTDIVIIKRNAGTSINITAIIIIIIIIIITVVSVETRHME
jgi:hypothetical protein